MDTFISTVCFDVALSEKERAIIHRLVGGKNKFTVLKDAQIAVKIRIPKRKEEEKHAENDAGRNT